MKTPIISTRERRFIDAQGRQVLLHGINLVNKDPKVGYLGDEGAEFYAALQDWGFNCLRLGVIWDGLEPQPGMYNESYLKGIDQQISLAHQHGLMVFLDMHQDLYSVLFSDGAPAWATLTQGAPHIADSEVWSDAYQTSPAVQTALDNFWKNAPGPDGIGIQDHLARCWGVLAERYADHPTVIGYDLYNEPVPGSAEKLAHHLMFARGAKLLTDMGVVDSLLAAQAEPSSSDDNLDPVERIERWWLTPEGRFQILSILSDHEVYAQVVDAPQAVYNEFERGPLMGFYQRVRRAIRQHDSQGILFLETSMGSNLGVYSAIKPVTFPDGSRDPQQAYAPHGYDLVTDTAYLAQASSERIGLIFQRHGETAARINMPMLVGEWGAYDRLPDTLPAAWTVVHEFEKLLCSETHWAYFKGIEDTDCFPAVQRPYPERVAGKLLSYHYDPTSCIFTCAWEEDPNLTTSSRIYLPDWYGFEPKMVNLTPPGMGFQIVPSLPGSKNVFLEIPPLGKRVTRTMNFN
jgi:endoglycosylceramidase